jgi:glycosyltransferase involved in cell wall biosynthesis
MRIVMVGPFGMRPKGTMSARALPLAKALAARHHQVAVLLPPWSCPEDSGKRWTADGVSIENIALPPRIPLLWHVWITWRLVRRVAALRPDVVHCFKPKAYAGLTAWALWWLKKLGLNSARLVVDSDDWEGAGGWNDVEGYSWLQKRFFAWQERWGLSHNDALTVASRTLQSIAWSMGVPRRMVWYVPNGVSASQVAPPRPVVGGGGPRTVLLYTRFNEFKLGHAVEVLRRVHEARPGVRFLVVGQGLSGEEQRFLDLCHGAGLGEALQYAGWVEAKRLPCYFRQADVAVYPFADTLIHRARCPVKLLDLMAAGIPIVADAVGQNAVTIAHGVSGLLVPPGDAGAMAEAVLGLLDNPALCAQLGNGAQRRILEHLTWEQLCTQAEAAYVQRCTGNERE